MLYNEVSELVGNTPIVKIDTYNDSKKKIFVKLEGCNPTGSIKDRLALGLIEKHVLTRKNKDLEVIGASGGSFGCALAFFGKLFGYSTKIVANDKMKKDKRDFIKFFDGQIIDYPGSTIDGNNYCKELIENDNSGRLVFLDQFHDWENPNVHYLTTGPEIVQDLPNIKAVVFCIGTSGSLYGISKFLKEYNEEIKIIGVTAKSGTKISGLYSFDDGDYITPFYKEFSKSGMIDEIIKVSENEAKSGLLELRNKGLYTGICSGAVFEGLKKSRDIANLDGDILFLSGDSGWKNTDFLSSLIKTN